MKTRINTTKVFVMSLTIGLLACNALRKPTSKPNEDVKKIAYADKILLHMHPEKVLNYLPDLKDEQIAYLFGMTVEDYQKAKKEYDDQARQAAVELLQDKEVADKVVRMPFKKNESILVLGESTTDALNSWVVILEYLLKLKRPDDNIKIINGAVAGQTTTEALKRITTQVKHDPDWILCFLGSNDCGRYGDENNKTIVSISESLNNLSTIRRIVSDEIPKTRFVWLNPLPINENKTSFFPPFKKMQLHFSNMDLLALGDSLKLKKETVIDLRNEIGVPAKNEFVQFDGAHLTIEGQIVIVKCLLNTLSK